MKGFVKDSLSVPEEEMGGSGENRTSSAMKADILALTAGNLSTCWQLSHRGSCSLPQLCLSGAASFTDSKSTLRKVQLFSFVVHSPLTHCRKLLTSFH